ncbi:putative zinc transporter msc2 [Ceratobasidium sp. 428]|nr:putative zinc transporter msc2 [Ceratobasidium sp. 428]
MVDLRVRSKTSLNPRSDGFGSRSRTSDHAARVLSNAVLACGTFAAKNWLFERGVGSVWLAERVLFCAAIGAAVKMSIRGGFNLRRIEWPLLGLSAFLNFVRIASFCAALPRMGALRLLIFAYFTPNWIQSVISPHSARAATATVLSIGLSALSDAQWSTHQLHTPVPAYGFLVLYALASWAHEHTTHALAPAMNGAGNAGGVSMIGALICAIPAHFIAVGMQAIHPTPALPTTSLLAILILATAMFLHSSLNTVDSRPAVLPLLIVFVMGLILFRSSPGWADFGVAGLMTYGASHTRTLLTSDGEKPQPTSRLLRSYLKTILANPESRKIFYFLMLNLCYMLVQMLYGVWTNSLGLISDAIHMAFDCMAIGMGLFASVMATWSPNERFTYGYGRVETLSGFANGIFLILISIFIVFEAIQRILDPPEMNTNQLLLVSGLGLGVNLFGMFAMGGHHHGHSHGGHSHGGGHGHSHASSSHSHSHDHGHSHDDHGHSHGRRESTPQPSVVINGIGGLNGYGSHAGHSHDSDHGDHHGHSHDGDHGHSHSDDHGHSHDGDHGHSHNGDGYSHSGGHGHSHNDDHGHSHDDHHNHNHNLTNTHLRIQTPSNDLVASPDGLLSPTLPFMPANMRSSPIQIPSQHDERNSVVSPITPAYPYYNDPHEAHHHGGGSSGHEHGHEHGQSHNMRGVFLHVMADTLGSVGVIVSTLLIQWYGWTGFDPIASLFIAVLIAASVLPLVIDCAKVLSLDVGERETSIRQALIELSSVDGLASYTAPRFWPKDGESMAGSIHIQLAPSAASYDPAGAHRAQHTTYVNAERVVDRVEQLLRSRIHGLDELAIQVEGSRDQPWCSCLNDVGPGRGGV